MKCQLCLKNNCICCDDIKLPTKSTLSSSATEFPDPHRIPKKQNIRRDKIKAEIPASSPFRSKLEKQPFLPFQQYMELAKNELKECAACSKMMSSSKPSRLFHAEVDNPKPESSEKMSTHSRLSSTNNDSSQQNNLHKPKSNNTQKPLREAIIKVSQLSNDCQSTRSAKSSRDQTLDVASRSSSRRSHEKAATNSSSRELRGCYERVRSPCLQVRPLFPNHRNQRVLTPKPACAHQKGFATQQNVPSKHSVCIIQNFEGNLGPYLPPTLPVSSPEDKKPDSESTESKQSSIEMSQDIGSCCAKYILCLFNFIFFILGSLVLGLGLWLLLDKNSIVSLLKSVNSEHVERFTEPQLIDQSVYLLIAIGGLMFFLGFLGYCGAMRESQCLLSLYGVFVIILLVLEIVVFCFAIIYKDVAKSEAENFLKNTIREYKSSEREKDGSTLMWNQLMARLECCGVRNYNDFESSPYWMANKSSRSVPEACCILSDKTLLKPVDSNCPYSPSDSNSFYMKGCYDSLLSYLEYNKNLVIGVSSGLILIQLFAAFLAFCLS